MSQRKKSQPSSRPTAARRSKSAAKSMEPGQRGQAPGLTLQSYDVGAWPLITTSWNGCSWNSYCNSTCRRMTAV